MLLKLGDHIASANAMALAAEERSKEAADHKTKADLLEMAQAWRHVAQGFEFVASLEKFLLDAHKAGELAKLVP